jgi:methyl-accepting chemotaxis protein
MALVKKSALGARKRAAPEPTTAPEPRRKPPRTRSTPRTAGSAVDRIDQATQELAGGLAQSAAAAGELQRAVEQISSGAEEAAGAAQESLGLIAGLRAGFRDATERASASLRQTELVQAGFAEAAAQIDASVASITLNARRQLGSVTIIERLELAARGIATVGATVGDLSEQTGMLAINAAIEAERAGDAGQGFAIVADEVRALADGADRNAVDIRALAATIQAAIRAAADRIRAAAARAEREAQGGRAVIEALRRDRAELSTVILGATNCPPATMWRSR